ncbi:hypothetical protein HanPI659440_Chr10g0399981 [Helianthus annuus]|nr:hypothetical protein HanPI659440_Chr10g0399981 [Helianthus annuus]
MKVLAGVLRMTALSLIHIFTFILRIMSWWSVHFTCMFPSFFSSLYIYSPFPSPTWSYLCISLS